MSARLSVRLLRLEHSFTYGTDRHDHGKVSREVGKTAHAIIARKETATRFLASLSLTTAFPARLEESRVAGSSKKVHYYSMETTAVVQRNTIAATKSLRPRDFQRQTLEKELKKDEKELFLQKNIPTLKSGTFFQIHTACQQEPLDRYCHPCADPCFNIGSTPPV